MILKVIAEDFIHPDAVPLVMPLYDELVAMTRCEPACIAYELFADPADPGHFVFVEEWPDRAALAAHVASDHFQRLVPQINAHSRQEGTALLMDLVF